MSEPKDGSFAVMHNETILAAGSMKHCLAAIGQHLLDSLGESINEFTGLPCVGVHVHPNTYHIIPIPPPIKQGKNHEG